ncbi:MAG: hypothetical protein JJE04_13065, partial [Acidobacteriia bacterium]|nr:hypothetical protein [Terriglobia bacterium]
VRPFSPRLGCDVGSDDGFERWPIESTGEFFGDDGLGQIDVVQVDLTRCGGFTEAMKIAALAWDRGLPVANHGFTTYVNVTAALHWLNSIPNALICEFVAEEETNLRESVTRQKLRARDGYLEIPQEPGLGIDLDEEAIAKYRVA